MMSGLTGSASGCKSGMNSGSALLARPQTTSLPEPGLVRFFNHLKARPGKGRRSLTVLDKEIPYPISALRRQRHLTPRDFRHSGKYINSLLLPEM